MAKDKRGTKYLLVENTSLDTILSPLKGTQRIKYTCFDVSQNFIIYGATSGGIYIFSREPCHFLQLLPNKDGSMSNVSISPDEKYIGFSTSRGVVAVLERNDEGGALLVSRTDEHSGANVTSLTWSDNSNQLYIADSSGQLSVINISLFINKSIFQLPSLVIIKLDSEIFQVSCCGDLLLASTHTRCYICDTVKEQYKQIGTKLREGIFGASFIKYPEGEIKAFCARPGSRLWEVDTEGSVLCTHQFKEALTSDYFITVSIPESKIYKNEFPAWQERAITFPYLFPISNKYLFTFKQDSFYIFDPENVELIVCCNHFLNIVDARCVGNVVYIWNSEGILQEFVLTSVENSLMKLYYSGSYSLCVELCELYAEYIEILDYNKLIMLSPLLGLLDHIDNLHLNNNLSNFFVNLNNCCNIQSFRINLNNSLENHFKITKFCDKSNSIIPNNGLSSQTTKIVNCFCHIKNIDCVCEEFSDNKSNGVSFLDNNIHNNEFSVNNGLVSFISSESSPETSRSISPNNLSSVFETSKKLNGKLDRHLFKKVSIFNDKFQTAIEPNKKPFNNKELTSLDLSDSDDSIVVGREKKEKLSHSIPATDFSPLIAACDNLIKSDSVDVELFAQFLNKLFVVYNGYKNIATNEKSSQEIKIFPINKYLPEDCIGAIKKCFYDIVNSGKFLECYDLLPKDFLKSGLLLIKYPTFLLQVNSKTDLELDITLSNILVLILDILDPYTILDVIENIKLPCSFMSWSVVLQSFQDNTFDYISIPQESYKFNDWPLPVVLNIIFLMLRLDQVESACYTSKEIHINLRHILYLILKLQLQLESSEIIDGDYHKHCCKLFLKYLTSLLEINTDLSRDLCCEIVRYVEIAFETVSERILCHNCNFPVIRKKTENNFELVGEMLLKYYSKSNNFVKDCDIDIDTEKLYLSDGEDDNSNRNVDSPSESLAGQLILNNCLKKLMLLDSVNKIVNLVKVIPNVVVNLLNLNYCEISDVLNFIAQFDLISFIESTIHSLSYEHWISLCECYKEMSQGLCCICHQPSNTTRHNVDWNALANVMLLSLGSTTATSILEKYSSVIPPGNICLSFYRSAILSDILTLNKLDRLLYKDIMSTYHSQFIKEPIDSHLSQIGVVSMWEAESSDDSSEGNFPNVVHSKDRKHWGITLDVDVDICSKCSLVLNSEKLSKDGIRSFKCGHTYHVICLKLSNSLFVCSICS